MSVVLWIVAAVLALAFAASGAVKLIRSPQQLVASGMGWAEDFSPGMVKLIGGLEVAAAVGLILPPLLKIAPVLAPLAAVGLILVMIGAAITHQRRGETPMVGINVVLLLLAAFVAWGRFGPYSF